MNQGISRREWLGIVALMSRGCRPTDAEDASVDAAASDTTGASDATGRTDALESDGADTAPDAQELPPIAALDRVMNEFMSARAIPGGSLAIVRNRRLVYTRGYGQADVDSGALVGPDSLFRIASLSKPFTAVAAMKLVERGQLDLNARAFEMLGITPFVPPGRSMDPRVMSITVRQLLQHLGGWDRSRTADPLFQLRVIAGALSVASPPSPSDIIRYQLGQPLDFDPGARFAYSNFGYCVLGRIIERVSGMPYAEFVRREVLQPAGITRMRQGASLVDGRVDGEVTYYTSSNGTATSVFDDQPGVFRIPYGAFSLAALDSVGGWIASAVDLARFAAALDDRDHSPILARASFDAMYALPDAPAWRNADGTASPYHYGCGWLVRPATATTANCWHDGSLPGTFSYLVRLANGFSWAALFNLRSDDTALPNDAIDGAMNTAIASVAAWPSADLFSNHP